MVSLSFADGIMNGLESIKCCLTQSPASGAGRCVVSRVWRVHARPALSRSCSSYNMHVVVFNIVVLLYVHVGNPRPALRTHRRSEHAGFVALDHARTIEVSLFLVGLHRLSAAITVCLCGVSTNDVAAVTKKSAGGLSRKTCWAWGPPAFIE
jgi:hypothetical protein